jgi:hypothetical protein
VTRTAPVIGVRLADIYHCLDFIIALQGVGPRLDDEWNLRFGLPRAKGDAPLLAGVMLGQIEDLADSAKSFGGGRCRHALRPLQQRRGFGAGQTATRAAQKGAGDFTGLCAGATVKICDKIAHRTVA